MHCSLLSMVLVSIFIIIIYFILFGHTARHVGSLFPDQELNLGPLQWKLRVLTAGLPRKSLANTLSCRGRTSSSMLEAVPDHTLIEWVYLMGKASIEHLLCTRNSDRYFAYNVFPLPFIVTWHHHLSS